MKKHILLISQHFYPEHFRINDVCQEWVKREYKVTVITGIPNYPQGNFFDGYSWIKKRKEIYNGIEIIRIPILPRKNNKVMLSLNYLSFVVSGWIWNITTKIKADLVLINEPSPMTQGLVGIRYAKRNKVPCYIYVKDLWPDSVEMITGIKSKALLYPINKMVDKIYKNCNKIFTSSKGFNASIAKRGVPKDKLIYWPQYAEDIYSPADSTQVKIKEIPKNASFNILFAGNFGQAQGLWVLPECAKILKNKNLDVTFRMIGDGRYKDELLDLIKTNDVEDMFSFIKRQPANKIPEFMAVCDATLITLSKSDLFAITLPSKTQSCLACKIPIIVSADGEVQNVINEAKAGVCSDAGDANMLATNIHKLMSMSKAQRLKMAENGLKYYKKTFSKEKLLDEMDRYLDI